MYLHRKICRESRHFQFICWCWSECDVTTGTLAMAAIVRLFVDSQRLIARNENRTKCVKYVWLSYPMWPRRWVLCISMQWLRLKGCHVACDEWKSGEICSLQHMWVIGSVMWAAASDESRKFGVQGATATDFRELKAREITGFDCIPLVTVKCNLMIIGNTIFNRTRCLNDRP